MSTVSHPQWKILSETLTDYTLYFPTTLPSAWFQRTLSTVDHFHPLINLCIIIQLAELHFVLPSYCVVLMVCRRKKCELPKTNKRFLSNVVLGAMASNKKKMRLEPESRKKSHTLPSSMTQKRLDKKRRHQRGSASLSGKTQPRPDDQGREQRGHSIASSQKLKEESFQTSRKYLSKQPIN